MDRKLIPIAELMTYVRFTRAGKCKIYGIVMDGADGRQKLHEKWMRKHYGDYDDIVNTYEDELYKDLDYAVVTTSEFVEIPEGVFGKEPSPWVKWYVNLWHNSKDRITDECDFRKRFLIAFLFKWIPFLPFVTGWILGRVFIAGGACMLGYFRHIKFLRAFRPYKYPSLQYNVMDDLDNLVEDNFFIIKRPDLSGRFHNRKTPMFVALPFAPMILLVMAGVAGFTVDPNGLVGYMAIVGSFAAAGAALGLVIDIIGIIIELLLRYKIGSRFLTSVDNFFIKIFKWVQNHVTLSTQTMKIIILSLMGVVVVGVMAVALDLLIAAVGIVIVGSLAIFGLSFLLLLFSDKILGLLDKFFAMSAKDNDYGNITELLCPKEEDNLRPNYKYIPKKQRTVRLWYRDLKNKVCKPMQS